MAYTAYVLTDAARTKLLAAHEMKYDKVIAHHVTVNFGVPSDTPPPAPADVRIVGYADSGDGIECFIVSVDGTTDRPGGGTYHITLSLDPDKYKPVDSNALIKHGYDTALVGSVAVIGKTLN